MTAQEGDKIFIKGVRYLLFTNPLDHLSEVILRWVDFFVFNN